MANSAKQERFCIAHRALIAACQDWQWEFRKAHATLRYEDLFAVAERMNEQFEHFVAVSGTFCQEEDAAPRCDRAITALTANVETLSASIARCRELSGRIAYDSRYLSNV